MCFTESFLRSKILCVVEPEEDNIKGGQGCGSGTCMHMGGWGRDVALVHACTWEVGEMERKDNVV